MRHLAVAAIAKWEGVQLDGKDLPFTEENGLMVLEKYRFIQDQIEAFGGDPRKFFQGLIDGLCDCVREFARLGAKDKNGVSIRDHLTQAGRPPDDPAPPEGAEHVLRWFWALDSARSCGFAPNPISFSEIEAWAKLTGADPLPWEVRAIKAMDMAYLNELAKRGQHA